MAGGRTNNSRASSSVAVEPGSVIAQYKLLEQTETGGVGEVYRATDTELGRQVMLKFLPRHKLNDAVSRARFVQAAQTAAALYHPNVVPINRISEYNEQPYVVLELLRGQPLRRHIGKPTSPIERTLAIGIQTCEALHAAHSIGLAHLALHPDNIIVDDDDWVQVLDFGLAALDVERALADGGRSSESIGYVAPEQIADGRADARADIFSFGVILYELVTGYHPFVKENVADTLQAIRTEIPRPLAQYTSAVPAALQAVLDKALQKDPESRYGSADVMVGDLKREQEKWALRESEARYRSLNDDVLDSSWVGICILDAEFRIVWVNRAFERYFGLRREKILGRDNRRLVSEHLKAIFEDPETIANRILAAYDDNSYMEHFECHALPGGGRQERWLEHWSQPIRTGLYAGGRIEHYADISKSKRAELKLEESHRVIEQERKMFISGPVVVFKWRNEEDWPVDYVSPNLADIMGYRCEELTKGSLTYAEMVDPEDLKRVRNEVRSASQSGADNFEHRPYRIITGDGRTIWVADYTTIVRDRSGDITHYLGYVIDITEQRHAQEALRESEERYRLLVNSAGCPITLLSPDGIILMINDTGSRNIGGEVDNLIGKSIYDMVPSMADTFRQRNQMLLETRTPLDVEDRMALPSGEKWFSSNLQLVKNPQTGEFDIQIVSHEITELKEAEQKLWALHEHLNATLDALPDIMFEVDRDGRIFDYRTHHPEWLYAQPSDFLGKLVSELLPKDATKVIMAALAEAAIHGKYSGGMYSLQVAGEQRWFELSIAAKGNLSQSDVRFIALARDVTERKQHEDALRDIADQLRAEREAIAEKNIALKQVLDHIEKDRQDFKQHICEDVKAMIMPHVRRLRGQLGGTHERAFEALENEINSLLDKEIDAFKERYSRLTPRELEICELIKQRYTSKQISEQLNLSLVTVHKHREQIRRKLGITNRNINLGTYLHTH